MRQFKWIIIADSYSRRRALSMYGTEITRNLYQGGALRGVCVISR